MTDALEDNEGTVSTGGRTIINLCFAEPEGDAKYKEVNNNIKRSMKKAKENWIGEQCSEIEENLRKNNSKRAYELVKDFTTVKQGKVTTVQDRSGKCLTEERQILN